jgi:LmbE family N-acetylglucosaminyl deacetylase
MTHYRTWEPLLPARAIVHGRCLVLAPHPDDELIGCGGAIMAHREAGAEVDVLVMTDGGLGNPGGAGGADYTSMRKEEARLAVEHLGGATLHFLDHPDGRLKDAHGAVSEITSFIQRAEPASIFLPSPYEVHPDHRATALHAFRALRGLAKVPKIYCFEIGAMMPANLLIDITPFMLRKEAALKHYHSQLLHQDLAGKMRALNRARTVNVDDSAISHAEALIHVEAAQRESFLEAVERLLVITDAMSPR